MKEARDELVDCMTKEKFQGKIVIVLAGYETEMEQMLTTNPGLASRFPSFIYFSALTGSECLELLVKHAEKQAGLKVRIDIRDTTMCSVFEKLSKTKGWGNSRDVLNICNKAISLVFARLSEDPDAVACMDAIVLMEVLEKQVGHTPTPASSPFHFDRVGHTPTPAGSPFSFVFSQGGESLQA